MRVTFLDHSGFLVEADSAALLFDWWKGELPAIAPGIPLYVFASHKHEDHFSPKIFALDDGTREARFLLGRDILPKRNQEKWHLSPDTVKRCTVFRGDQRTGRFLHISVEALRSTDQGAAFLVTLPGGRTVFHAGDLNWWHWEGEDKSWNHNMAANFKRYTEPLRGRRIDLAMLPLDPRLGEAGFWGPKYFLELADIRAFLPMHQWGDFGFTRQFLDKHPDFAPRTVPVERPGQTFTF